MVTLPGLFGDVWQLWPYFLLIQNNTYALHHAEINFLSVSWSLCIEEHFYLCFPLLFVLARSRKVFSYALMLIVAIAVVMRAVPHTLGALPRDDWEYFFSICRLDGLAIGAAVAVVCGSRERLRVLAKQRAWIAVAALLLAVGVLAEAKWKNAFGIFTHTWLALFYGSIVLLVLTKFSAARLLRAKVLVFFGNISYGLYLVHIPCLGLATALLWSSNAEFLGQRPVGCTAVAAVASVILAVASLHLFERPILNRVRRVQTYSPESTGLANAM
jgi:peptidoglycan/LPS O-acetylase OafA/YrhL